MSLSIRHSQSKHCRLTSLKVEGDLIVWWYGGFKKNPKVQSVPHVTVFFRIKDKKGMPGVFREFRDIPVTELGLLSIGSIWTKGSCSSEIEYQTATFDLDFTEGNGWKVISPQQKWQDEKKILIDKQDYQLRYQFDRNWLIDFTLQDGKNLLVPCLEYFTSCYGRSAEVKRVLSTYPWEEVEKRFYAPVMRPVVPNKWPVKLTSRLINDDVKLLAHIYYDNYTRLASKQIYSQLETLFDKCKKDDSPIFIKIRPWFQGQAKMMVKGLWINKGRTFLGLQVCGCSDPGGVPILRSRDQRNKIIDANSEKPSEVQDSPIRVLNKLPEIINLTEDNEPSHDTPSVAVEDRSFIVLGEPRIVIDVKEKEKNWPAESYRENRKKVCGVDEFATGEPYGSGKGIGQALISSRTVMESHGVLRDMWNAFLNLKQKHPDIVESVKWFTFENGFCENPEPQLISLTPFNNDECTKHNIKTEIRNWVYLEVPQKITRGILVTKITTTNGIAYIIEIQRRVRKKENRDGKTIEAEESLKGFSFALDDNQRFESYLRSLLSNIRYKVGVFERLTDGCPGKADTYKHVPANYEQIPCEATVKNALGKIGINF